MSPSSSSGRCISRPATAWPAGSAATTPSGLNATGTDWSLAKVATYIFNEYVLVANPSATEAASVLFTFRDHYGNFWTHSRVVQPGRRYTVKVNNVTGVVSQVSTTVEANIEVVA